MEKGKLTYSQKTFGNQHDWAMKKMKATITNPEGTLTLIPFDDQPNKLSLLITLFPEALPKTAKSVLIVLKNILKEHGDCPEGDNFWDWFVSIRKGRVATIHANFVLMFRYIQLAGYYSKQFKPTLLNYRLKQRDGVRKADTVLTEDEISYVIRKVYDLSTAANRNKQRALDTFVLALFTAARYNDVRSIVKSVDETGQPVLMYHNKKGTRSMSVAWNPAVEGALQRGLYKNPTTSGKVMYSALKLALYEALPSSSNRLISYYYIQPGKGRELKTDNRLSHLGFHTARHTFCTRLLRIGININIVSQLAGHKSIQTTMKYYNWTREAEANNVLREVYGIKALVAEKKEWGEGAGETPPIPAEIHAAQMPQPQISVPAPDDGGMLAKFSAAHPKRKPSPKRVAWLNKLRAKGLLK